MKGVFASALALVLAAAVATSAHQRPDENFAAVQVPIDAAGVRPVVMDGDLGEWDNVPSVFWTTHDDLTEAIHGLGDPDPANLATRVILGWSPVTNLFYFMEERFDDQFFGYTETNYENTEIALDFDHSGDEQFNDVASAGLDAERWEGALTQNYRWQLHIEGELFLWGAAPWAGERPYAGVEYNIEGDTDGGAVNLFVEMWVTPFDDLPTSSTGIDDADVVVHDLTEGEIIGVGFACVDDDVPSDGGYNGYWINSGDVNLYFLANAFVDYTLLGYDASIWVADAGTSVEADSWGRIKDTFAN